MLLSVLLKDAGLAVRASRGDVEVSNVQSDSRRCGPGSCFVAVRCHDGDGHEYIRAAIDAGASAVVCEKDDGCPSGLPVAVVDDTRVAAGRLAQAIRGWPARKLKCIGITGTNGKTTVAYMTRAILQAAGCSPAMLGTISYQTGKRDSPAAATTPDAVSLAEMTAEMIAAGKTHLVMEVSSHALDQGRAAGIEFDTAVYTNLTGDHLDYHGSMEGYLVAKLRLFQSLGPQGTAIVNQDDPFGQRVGDATAGAVRWYGLGDGAQLRASSLHSDATGSRFVLSADGLPVEATTSMIGRHNVLNCLAAAGAAMSQGVDLQTVAAGLAGMSQVPGRLQRVEADAPYRVFIDYAHTDDALENVLSSLRPVAAGRIILVFGCGGDRDRSKRPRMAKVAEQLADRIVITSDNPRCERPEDIIEQIVAGLSPAGRASADIQPDRRAAIEIAIGQAEDGDIVLIAGKGHENYQLIGDKRLDFDDLAIAEQIVRRREGQA